MPLAHVAIPARFLHPGPTAGLGRYSRAVVRALAVLRPEVQFTVLVDRRFDLAGYPPNVTARRVPPPARHPVLYYAWYHYALPRALRHLGAQAVFVPEPFAIGGTVLPQVLTVHDLAFWAYPETKDPANRWYYRWRVPRDLATAAAIVSISGATTAELRAAYPQLAPAVYTVPNGVDDMLAPAEPHAVAAARAAFGLERPYVLTLSALEPRKNLVRLLQAFDSVVGQGFDFDLVVGGAWAWRYGPIQAAYRALRHPGRVKLIGFVPETHLAGLYTGAYAFAYLSYYEGFGLPIAEAARCGTPALVGSQSSLPEVAGPGGHFVDPFSVPAIAAGLRHLASHSDYRDRLADAAADHSRRFTWQATAEGIWRALAEAYSAGG